MAALTKIKQGPDAGTADVIAALAAASAGGDSFNVQGNEFLVINNAGGSTCVVTLTSVADNFGVVTTGNDITLSVLAGKLGIFGPFGVGRFRDVNGNAQITYSQVVTVTVGVFGAALRAV